MNIDVVRFFEKYDADPELRSRLKEAEAMYPGSLEIRDAVVQDVLLPAAEEMGYSFTVEDLFAYEKAKKAAMSKDRELTEEELAKADEEPDFWLVDRGWQTDKTFFDRFK